MGFKLKEIGYYSLVFTVGTGITKFLDYALSLMRSPHITVYFLSLLTSSNPETRG